MSMPQFLDAADSSADLQIWNNAAFDNGEISEDLAASKQPWGSLKPNFGNPNSSFDSVPDKENQGFASENQNQFHPVSPFPKSASTTPFKPLTAVESVQRSKMRAIADKGFEKNPVLKIDEEIEEIELQITRLNSRLEALKAEKASAGAVEKRGRFVAAKFMEQKQGGKNDEISNLGVRTKANRRGISLGPAEILSAGRRGMSLGPSEIFGAAKSRQVMINNTPLQSRRQSCLFKLQGIDEERVESCSLSLKSRQAVTTIGSRKAVKKEESVLNTVQPKKLFRDGEKSVPNKKASRPGRVVASRYNQGASQASAMRKISLPESDGDAGKRVDKTRSFSVGKTRANEGEGRVKKRWEIPSEIIVHSSVRGGGDGEAEGEKSYFAIDEVENSVSSSEL
ncbi:hypothetical protein SASPL_153962 [Salvia splendens]|uniref:Uncharacterized protein n=1 Tax=Salvia splendens TaxID=180675 RepID=A0A8X8VZF4_SALSN|nr:uncharacterized protein LOC121788078 [Salvia splendens]KAG6385134.1 hypothetical protein SASPL_153962 [Salvia splendens]